MYLQLQDAACINHGMGYAENLCMIAQGMAFSYAESRSAVLFAFLNNFPWYQKRSEYAFAREPHLSNVGFRIFALGLE